jgi:hypothetical protein
MKQSINISFGKGLDTKTDPWHIPVGKFLSLENTVFTSLERLTKRNGYGYLPPLPQPATFITTFNKNLTAIGSNLQALSESTNQWFTKGTLQPLELEVLPLIRSNTNQSQADTAIAPNGLICTVYTDQTPTSLSTPRYMYVVANSVTGQNIIQPTVIPGLTGVVTGSPRVFILGAYFVIVFTNVISSASHLQYIAISTNNPNIVTTNTDITSNYAASSGLSWDGFVANGILYFAYDTTSGGQSIQLRYLSSTLGLSGATTYSTSGKVTATLMSVTADTSGTSAIIYASYYDSATSTGYTLAVDSNLNKIISTPVETITSGTILNLATVAQGGVLTLFYEVSNNYGYDSSIPTHYISTVTCTQSGTVGATSILCRSVGLASKAFLVNGEGYFVGAYQSVFQPTYFLFNQIGQVVARFAYANGGGYCTKGLPSVTVTGAIAQLAYLFKDFVTSQNTSTTESITKSNIYSQTGINLISFTIGTSNVIPVEIGQSLHLSGGFLWQYDGYIPVEHNFYVWPDSVEGSPVNSGGAMLSQEYQYQAVYTWTDNQGNVHYSAPSIPNIVDMSTANKSFTQPTALTPTANLTIGSNIIVVSSATGLTIGQIVTDTTTPANIQAGSYITKIAGTSVTLSLPATATATGDTLSIASINSVTLNIPTLRLTYKIANPVKIEIFRWSVAQQEFFQITSLTQPLINNTSVDYVTYTDTQADNQILGNSLIYTTGGVVEDIGAPSFNSITLFDDRVWGIDAEDPNLLWYSKQVIEATPVEMSDLFTLYVPPSTAAQGSTGNIQCLFPMDDKLILFKANAIYFINGTGPDNTGANSQYSNPIFVTSTVGTIDQQSIGMTDNGLMFQSDKGYWLLERSAQQCVYLGAAVEEFTLEGTANSAMVIPETTQFRATLDSGVTLMMDYFNENQWGTFSGVPAISATIYQNFHTFLDKYGRLFQETPGSYLDGTNPVLMSFQTGWINIAGISGYQRIYELIFLGKFLSPANLVVSIAYDFKEPVQQSIITPTNYTGVYGSDSLYGQTSPYGGEGPVLQWRVQTQIQKCQVFQISVQEQFDPSYGTVAGAGFTLSGITGVIDIKKGYRPIKTANTVG